MATCVARHRRGDINGAKTGYLEVLQADPDHPQALSFLGTIDAQLGNLDDAERLIRRAISVDPGQASFYNNLGTVLREKGDHNGAIQAYQQALRLDDQLIDAYSNLGASQIDAGEIDDALVVLRRGLEINPDFAPLHNNLGRAYNNLRRLGDAEEAFKAAIRLQPTFAQAQNNLGHVFRSQDRLVEASTSFQAAVESDPKHSEAYRNLGIALMARDLPDEAIDAFKNSLRLEPDNVATLLNLGVVFHRIGKIGNAITCYREAVSVEPDNALAHLNFGILLSEQMQVKHAEEAIRHAISIKPDYVDAYAELADLFMETGQLEKLEDLLKRGLDIAPDHPQLNLEFARFLRLGGQTQQALDTLSKFDWESFPAGLKQQYAYELGYINDRLDNTEVAMLRWDEANRLASKSLRRSDVKAQRYLDKVDALTTFIQNTEPSRWQKHVAEDNKADPVFLIGFPQTGVNLIHKVLSGYPQLHILNESPNLSHVEKTLTIGNYGYPTGLAVDDLDLWQSLRAEYFSGVTIPTEKLLVDKFALRTIHIGLIWRLFPDAKLIFCARHPCEVVMNVLMGHQVLNDSTANFFDLPSAVRLYDKVMSLWYLYLEKFDLNHHTVKFEDLLGDQETKNTLLGFLGLKPQQNSASSLFRAGLSFSEADNPCWTRYSSYLEPHMELLAPHIKYFGY